MLALNNLAYAQFMNGNLAEARTWAQSALAVDPKMPHSQAILRDIETAESKGRATATSKK